VAWLLLSLPLPLPLPLPVLALYALYCAAFVSGELSAGAVASATLRPMLAANPAAESLVLEVAAAVAALCTAPEVRTTVRSAAVASYTQSRVEMASHPWLPIHAESTDMLSCVSRTRN
jgi:hypothetical protein